MFFFLIAKLWANFCIIRVIHSKIYRSVLYCSALQHFWLIICVILLNKSYTLLRCVVIQHVYIFLFFSHKRFFFLP